jgi:excisionase family DNA binding protein
VPGKLMTFEEVAEHLATNPRHVYRLSRRTEDPLPSFKLGKFLRVDADQLSAWLAREAERSNGPDAA